MQQREFEEGLVGNYRKFLENCENEIRVNSLLSPVALRCLCELLKEKSHFNFSVNIIEVIVKTLGRRTFDEVWKPTPDMIDLHRLRSSGRLHKSA